MDAPPGNGTHITGFWGVKSVLWQASIIDCVGLFQFFVQFEQHQIISRNIVFFLVEMWIFGWICIGGLKFENEITHAKLRGRDPIFRFCPIIRTFSFTWTDRNKFSTTPCKSPVLFRPSAIISRQKSRKIANEITHFQGRNLNFFVCLNLDATVKMPISMKISICAHFKFENTVFT